MQIETHGDRSVRFGGESRANFGDGVPVPEGKGRIIGDEIAANFSGCWSDFEGIFEGIKGIGLHRHVPVGGLSQGEVGTSRMAIIIGRSTESI